MSLSPGFILSGDLQNWLSPPAPKSTITIHLAFARKRKPHLGRFGTPPRGYEAARMRIAADITKSGNGRGSQQFPPIHRKEGVAFLLANGDPEFALARLAVQKPFVFQGLQNRSRTCIAARLAKLDLRE